MILSLETSTSVCSIALHNEGKIIGEHRYFTGKSHSSVLPLSIDHLLENCQVSKSELKAVAVSGGPGSYTGLRIGTATAKGLCLGLDVPLIAVPTLEIYLSEALRLYRGNHCFIPMMDARRMEVYLLVADSDGRIVEPARAQIVSEQSFQELLDQDLIIFGDGAEKCLDVIAHPNVTLGAIDFPSVIDMGMLAFDRFTKNDFADLAYFEPAYLKPFQTKTAKNQLTPS